LINNITIFDFETTGLNPETDRVIEMAAVRVRNGIVVGEFSTLVNHPEITSLPPKITEITGITTDMMREGISERSAFQMLNRFIGDSTLVAHNAAFDLSFLHYVLMRLAGRTFDNPFIDTLSICRDRFAYPHKLTDMCDRLGIRLDGAHRALNDVYGCWELLKVLHEAEPVDTWMNTLGYLNKYGPPKWVPDYARVIGQNNRYENAG
jgi:DNA polymerase III subunit epsilon